MSHVSLDEVEALRAIYDADFRTISEERRVFSITVRSGVVGDTQLCLDLLLIFPENYPDTSPPEYELKNSHWLDSVCASYIAENLSRIYSENQGEVVVYQWVEWIRDYITSKAEELQASSEVRSQSTTLPEASCSQDSGNRGDFDNSEADEPATSTILPPSSKAPPLDHERPQPPCPSILHGEPLTDRKSTFQAHVAEVATVDEVRAVLMELKSTRKIATATHNILAYRLYDELQGVFRQDCDDDGEAAAGGRLLHLLQIMDIRNAMVVVTRWFGGILLHSDRFKHINNVARILLQESGVGQKHKESAMAKIKQKKSVGSRKSKAHHR